MLAQTEHSNLIFSIIAVVFGINSIGIGIMLKLRANDRREFEEHKKSVQYKDTCTEVVKRQDERHEEIKDTCIEIKKDIKEIANLIRNGHGAPRVQT